MKDKMQKIEELDRKMLIIELAAGTFGIICAILFIMFGY